ncbi:hypothetical protein FA95DRAFT_1680485 [Auriscalpium vulgare]|uniref:Uncharacterized protein n=1 Tax=Auriscalpium vulgare TaxID=40419 RepID=A0ACB8RNF4_9AGAM|nr:hypothetical protein FA95DRAFT_1680485 [Auriscalpium vulgare]
METQEVEILGESTHHSQLFPAESSSTDSLVALSKERHTIASVLSIVDTRINASTTPILRLPPELLVSVLSYLTSGVVSEHVKSMNHFPPTVPWVRLTWVCRLWRHVMLSNSTLWCDFVLPLPPQWARAMLVRSQRRPLSIYYFGMRGYDKPPASSLAWVLPFDTLEQVRSIHVHHGRSNFPGNLSQLLLMPAPILEFASFSNTLSHLARDALFANNAPRLRNLRIDEERVLPLSSFLPNIVSLVIHSSNFPNSLPEFIAALQRLKQIKTLTLWYQCLDQFSFAPHYPAASQIVRLASLNSLEICGTASECISFLRHVQIPDTACLHIRASTRTGVDAFAPLYPFLAPAGGYRSNPFRNVQFSSYGPDNLTFFARNLDADQAPFDRKFSFEWNTPRATVFDLLPVLCAELQVHHSVSLSVEVSLRVDYLLDDRLKVPPEGWLGMLGAATELRTLHADVDTGPMLCQILSTSILDDGTYSREAECILVWPKLQVLKLNYVDLSFCYEDTEENSWAECIGMRVDERGAALNTLCLTSCRNFYPDWLESVERVVDRVLVQDDRVNWNSD